MEDLDISSKKLLIIGGIIVLVGIFVLFYFLYKEGVISKPKDAQTPSSSLVPLTADQKLKLIQEAKNNAGESTGAGATTMTAEEKLKLLNQSKQSVPSANLPATESSQSSPNSPRVLTPEEKLKLLESM